MGVWLNAFQCCQIFSCKLSLISASLLLLLPLEQPTVVNIQVIEDWKFIAMVLDRLFLWLFTIAVLGGTAWIILRAPSLYDMREPIDKQISGIPRLF